nr:MAG TPA: hypothetical protein [Caudoviricetes sp.]
MTVFFLNSFISSSKTCCSILFIYLLRLKIYVLILT